MIATRFAEGASLREMRALARGRSAAMCVMRTIFVTRYCGLVMRKKPALGDQEALRFKSCRSCLFHRGMEWAGSSELSALPLRWDHYHCTRH